jgi:hypothetical protein
MSAMVTIYCDPVGGCIPVPREAATWRDEVLPVVHGASKVASDLPEAYSSCPEIGLGAGAHSD